MSLRRQKIFLRILLLAFAGAGPASGISPPQSVFQRLSNGIGRCARVGSEEAESAVGTGLSSALGELAAGKPIAYCEGGRGLADSEAEKDLFHHAKTDFAPEKYLVRLASWSGGTLTVLEVSISPRMNTCSSRHFGLDKKNIMAKEFGQFPFSEFAIHARNTKMGTHVTVTASPDPAEVLFRRAAPFEKD